MGTAFALWYVKSATADVVYSDYIRLVNSYLPDVWNPAKFFVPDVLTRIPVSYLARIVNVELFGFSVTFERVLGVLSLGLSGAVFGLYCRERRVGLLWFAMLSAVMFSLNKWEMLTNGSGWAHFLAFACFYYHEVVLDRVWAGKEKKTRPNQAVYSALAGDPGSGRPLLRQLRGHPAVVLRLLYGPGP